MENLILSIYDVGVGGLLNVFFEIVDGVGKGVCFELCKVVFEELGLLLCEIWLNEV